MASNMSVCRPGHSMLPLLINQDTNIDKGVVETKLRDLDHFRRVKASRPEELAILNLQGLLNLRLHRYEKALEIFRNVLSKDQENLNALANLQYVLEKLFKLEEAERYKQQQSRLLRGHTAGEDEPGSPESSTRQRCLSARCLAEQAYAFAFDIYSDNVERKKYMKAIEMYTKALTLAGEAVERTEKDDWKLCMAINAHRLFTYMGYYKTDAIACTDADEYIKMAVNLFFEITNEELGDREIQWDSWCHLGDIFRTMKRRKLSEVVPPELKEFQDDPEKCMLKAMEISPDNPRLLERYANFLYSFSSRYPTAKEVRKPLELLERSITLDNSEFNWKAFATRAMIIIRSYKSQRSGMSGPDALQRAKSDLEKAISLHTTPWDLANLGEVYHLLAKHHTERDSEERSLFERALVCFTKAADYPDGRKRHGIHRLRGFCLSDIGEKRAAIGCFKQAIECEPRGDHTGNFNELFKVYLSILQNKNATEDKSIFAETAFALKMALEKYGEHRVSVYCIEKCISEYREGLWGLRNYCDQYEEVRSVSSFLTSNMVEDPGRTLRGQPLSHKGNVTPRDSKGSENTSSVGVAVPFEEHAPHVERGQDKTVDAVEEEEPKEQPIRKAPDEARVPDFQYDFFVVYPQSERDWVYYDLLNELEAVRRLKGCTRYRDALAGTMKLTSEITLMTESASILLVINGDCHAECEASMHQALRLRKESKCRRVVIPVVRDDSQVPDEIDILNTFDATGPVDWDKLAHCIEQQIRN